MKGWVIATGSWIDSREIDSRALWFNFWRKISNRSRKLTFDIGLWKIIFFILIKAAATIRNFRVVTILSNLKALSPGS